MIHAIEFLLLHLGQGEGLISSKRIKTNNLLLQVQLKLKNFVGFIN